MSELITAESLAERLSVKPRTVRAWARDGTIPSVRITPKVIRFDLRAVLDRLGGNQTQEQGEEAMTTAATNLSLRTPSLTKGEEKLYEWLNTCDHTSDPKRQMLHQRMMTQLYARRHSFDQLAPVLNVAVAQLDGRTLPDAAWRDASRELAECFDDYVAVLQESIPPALLERATLIRDRKRYQDNTNDSAAEDFQVYRADLRTRRENPQYFPTGLACLDDALGGGIRGLTFLAGNKGCGKTTLQIATMRHVLSTDPNAGVLFYSLDAPRTTTFDRLMCMESGLTFHQLLDPESSDEQLPAVAERCHTLLSRSRIVERDLKLQPNHDHSEFVRVGLNASSIAMDARRLNQSLGVQRVLVLIDLFQKMVVSDGTGPNERDAVRLDAIQEASQSLSNFYGAGNVAFLITSEVRKEASRELNQDDLKGDGRIASDADTVLLMWPTEQETPRWPPRSHADGEGIDLTLRIGKGRDGVKRGDIPLRFRHEHYRFEDDSSAGQVLSAPHAIPQPTSFDPMAE